MSKAKMSKSAGRAFSRLVRLMERLRGERGCPWDKEQTHKSLIPYLFEESQEVKKAIQKEDWFNLEEELGDVLLQVLFHAQIAKERGDFDIHGVIQTLMEKLVHRHPHVFRRGMKKAWTSTDVLKNWDEWKGRDKKRREGKRRGLC